MEEAGRDSAVCDKPSEFRTGCELLVKVQRIPITRDLRVPVDPLTADDQGAGRGLSDDEIELQALSSSGQAALLYPERNAATVPASGSKL